MDGRNWVDASRLNVSPMTQAYRQVSNFYAELPGPEIRSKRFIWPPHGRLATYGARHKSVAINKSPGDRFTREMLERI